jgi:hypothetical protein
MKLVNDTAPVPSVASEEEDVADAYQRLIGDNLVRLFAQEEAISGTVEEIQRKARRAASEFLNLLIKKPQPYYDLRRLGVPSAFPKAVNTAHLLSKTFGLKNRAVILTNPEELKYISHSIDGMDIFLIAGDAGALNLQRSELVAQIAQFKKTRIHVLWTGELTAEVYSIVESITRSTGGHFLNLPEFQRKFFANP